MKYFSVSTILVLACNFFFMDKLNSQPYKPDTSAVWHTGSNWWNPAGYNVILYDPDSDYNGSNTTSYKVVRSWYNSQTQQSSISTINRFSLIDPGDGRVNLHMDDGNDFVYGTLYDFNADIGDFWFLDAEYFTKFTVTAKGLMNINGEELRYSAVDLEMSKNQKTYNHQDTIVERIGFLGRYFLPYDIIKESFDENEGGITKCYYDDYLGFVENSWYNCNFLEDYVGKTVLSLDRVKFDAKKSDESSVELSWSPSLDLSIDEYVLESRSYGQDWRIIHRVDAETVCDGETPYTFVDYHPATGVNYYRIKILNKQEPAVYTEIKSVKLFAQEFFTIFPNPLTEDQVLNVISQNNGKHAMKIYDNLGQKIIEVDIYSGHNRIELSKLEAGLYIGVINQGNNEVTHRILVFK